MSKENQISFEDWVVWMFDRDHGSWEHDVRDSDFPWLANSRLLTEHFIRLHEAPRTVLVPFRNEQIGSGLWALYSSHSAVGAPFAGPQVPRDLFHRAIRSVATLIRELAPKRIDRSESINGDKLHGALYMFWDIAPIWPFDPTDADRETLEVCLSEMRSALEVPHPVAAYHALHGLGHFAIQVPDRTTPIIDAWLATRPRIGPTLVEYAERARIGNVQ